MAEPSLFGRLSRIRDGVARLSGNLANLGTLADLKMNRLLTRPDGWASQTGRHSLERLDRPAPVDVPSRPTLELDLRRRDVGTVIFAPGYRPDHTWLELPVLDRKGRIRHDGGVAVDAPGVHLVGGSLLRRRSSSYIHGAEQDSVDLAEHLRHHLDVRVGSVLEPGKAAP